MPEWRDGVNTGRVRRIAGQNADWRSHESFTDHQDRPNAYAPLHAPLARADSKGRDRSNFLDHASASARRSPERLSHLQGQARRVHQSGAKATWRRIPERQWLPEWRKRQWLRTLARNANLAEEPGIFESPIVQPVITARSAAVAGWIHFDLEQ